MNRKYFVLFAAASMTAGTLTVQAQQAADTTGAQAEHQPAGVAADRKQSPYAEDIRRVLARVTEDGVKGKPKDIADNFTTNAQDQFKKSGKEAAETGPGAQAKTEEERKQEMKALDDQLKETSKKFTEAWKAKYNHDFSIDRKAEAMVYSGDMFQILQGDVSTAQPRTAGERQGEAADHANKAAKENEKRMATVMVQESHGLPALSLLLVNEGTFGNKWHIQPSPGLDYKTLSTNLNKQLQDMVAMKDQWPQDENEAYKIVSHHVLTAIAIPSGSQASSGQRESAQPAGYKAGEQQQPAQSSDQLTQPSR